MRRRDDGFTLIELVATLVIIGILTLLAIASYRNTTTAAARAACLHDQRVLTDAVIVYEADHGGAKPADLDQLKPYARDVDAIRFCPKDRTPLVYDPVTGNVTCPNHPND